MSNSDNNYDDPHKLDKAIDEAWAKEVEARIDAYERGEIKALSIEEVFRKYDKK